ncbi:MAG: DnaB-like helicase C-terminal domain-containing protein [Ktedonobacteraceae bacterium]
MGVGRILTSMFDDLASPHEPGGVITGVPGGFPDLDTLTGGFQPGNLILLAGRPGMGKTALALTIDRNAAIDYRRSVLFFSAEMSQDELTQRLVALEAHLDLSRVWKRNLTEEERVRLIEVSGTIMDAPILIDDTPAITLTAIRSKIRRALMTGDIDLIVVDYLQKLIATTENGKRYPDRVQEVSEIARGLKDIAREFHLPVLALAQLSRAVEARAEKVPQLSDLRDSGELEQEADLVLFLYRDEYYAGYAPDGSSRSARPGSAELICAKHRNGPLGELRLGFQASQIRFYNQESE